MFFRQILINDVFFKHDKIKTTVKKFYKISIRNRFNFMKLEKIYLLRIIKSRKKKLRIIISRIFDK